jgi:hypothetical protein
MKPQQQRKPDEQYCERQIQHQIEMRQERTQLEKAEMNQQDSDEVFEQQDREPKSWSHQFGSDGEEGVEPASTSS